MSYRFTLAFLLLLRTHGYYWRPEWSGSWRFGPARVLHQSVQACQRGKFSVGGAGRGSNYSTWELDLTVSSNRYSMLKCWDMLRYVWCILVRFWHDTDPSTATELTTNFFVWSGLSSHWWGRAWCWWWGWWEHHQQWRTHLVSCLCVGLRAYCKLGANARDRKPGSVHHDFGDWEFKVCSKHQGFLTKVVDFVLSSFLMEPSLSWRYQQNANCVGTEAGIWSWNPRYWLPQVPWLRFLVDAMMGRWWQLAPNNAEVWPRFKGANEKERIAAVFRPEMMGRFSRFVKLPGLHQKRVYRSSSGSGMNGRFQFQLLLYLHFLAAHFKDYRQCHAREHHWPRLANSCSTQYFTFASLPPNRPHYAGPLDTLPWLSKPKPPWQVSFAVYSKLSAAPTVIRLDI